MDGSARTGLVLLGWAAAGAMLAFGLAATFTPFLLLASPAVCLAVLTGLRTGFGRRAWAALAGAAWVPLWLAWQDRGGPGEVCHRWSAVETSCASVGSPWPWLAAGLLMAGAGLGLALPRRREREVAAARGV